MRVHRIVRTLVVALCRSSLVLLLTPAHVQHCCCQAQQQNIFETFVSSSAPQEASPRRPINVLLLMTDQQRYDALRRVQDELSSYDGKHKIRTPNLDRLATQGAFVRTAYSPCPVCGPARTVLRTGCTIERTGVQTNILDDDANKLNPKLFQDKIERLESLDQILVEDYGYVSEYYGKWHIPDRLYQRRDGSALAVQFNDYDFSTAAPTFRTASWETMLKAYLGYFQKRGDISKDSMQEGQQIDTYSKYPYTPISLDSRFGKPTGTSTTNFSSFDASQNSQMGNLTLHKNYSSSFLNHDVALRALNRLAAQDKPFILTVSYHHPHPPYMAPFQYLAHYWEQRKNLYTPPNVAVPLDDSTSYYNANEQKLLNATGYCDKNKIQEWTSVYYALVEEIDTLVGIMLSRLDALGLTNTTLVVFASDHGEMLGAHCLRGKNVFFEESARVPLMVKLPGAIAAGTIVEEPVGLIDIFSTILDYVGASASDKGDGSSFRPFIEGTSNNALLDETAVISEWDYREPTSNVTLSRQLDNRPNFMVRHGSFKLLMHKKADSKKPDVLYDLANDPFEMNNLINPKGPAPNDAVIGKAEHLRYLLIDWMERLEKSGRNNFYSDPIFNANEGLGDINEIRNRQSWPKSDIWVGDSSLVFRKVTLVGSYYIRYEWLYIGRRSTGSLSISSFKVLGKDSSMFRLSAGSAEVASFGVFRLQVRLEREINMPQGLLGPLDAYLEIVHNAGETIHIPLIVQQDVTHLPTPPPTRDPVMQILTSAPVRSIPTPTPVVTKAPTTTKPPSTFCFSGETTVVVKNKGLVSMKQLQLGDEVLDDSGNYELVYSFGHRHDTLQAEFLQFIPSNLEISRDHMLKSKGRYIPAFAIKVGDSLETATGELIVESIETVIRKGVYAPFTLTGTIQVNNIKASNYVAFQNSEHLVVGGWKTTIRYQWIAHISQASHRIWARTHSVQGHEIYSDVGISCWIGGSSSFGKWILEQNAIFAVTILVPMISSLIGVAAVETVITFLIKLRSADGSSAMQSKRS